MAPARRSRRADAAIVRNVPLLWSVGKISIEHWNHKLAALMEDAVVRGSKREDSKRNTSVF